MALIRVQNPSVNSLPINKIRVLLVSPCADTDPPGGDVTYTKNLLSSPPSNVQYIPYSKAMSDGNLREYGGSYHLRRALRERTGIGRAVRGLSHCAITNRLRRNGHLYPEPFRFFDVVPGVFDLIHVHVFHVGFYRRDCPAVFSFGGPLRWMYEDARSLSLQTIDRWEARDRRLANLLGVQRCSGPHLHAERILTYTDSARMALAGTGLEIGRIDLAPPSVQIVSPRQAHPQPNCIGFVARHFEDKGGPMVVEAVLKLQQTRPDVKLIIVGCTPPDSVKLPLRTDVLHYVPQRQLLDEILPALDVLAYPVKYDYPPPLTLSESMMRGVPIATHAYRDLPEIVADGGGSVEFDDVAGYASLLDRLLAPETNRRAGAAAHRRALQLVSDRKVSEQVGKSYRSALQRGSADGLAVSDKTSL